MEGKLDKKVSIKELLKENTPVLNDYNDIPNKMIREPGRVKYKKRPETPAYKPYYEKLRDPRWQRKRLEIMQRDNFCCTSCGSSTGTLNVHHTVSYRKNTDPWDYEDDELTTFCEECHGKISEMIYSITSMAMGRCYCVDSAQDMLELMYEIDGMNPWELKASTQLLKIAIRRDLFKERRHE